LPIAIKKCARRGNITIYDLYTAGYLLPGSKAEIFFEWIFPSKEECQSDRIGTVWEGLHGGGHQIDDSLLLVAAKRKSRSAGQQGLRIIASPLVGEGQGEGVKSDCV
jgi:hypothetical protein